MTNFYTNRSGNTVYSIRKSSLLLASCFPFIRFFPRLLKVVIMELNVNDVLAFNKNQVPSFTDLKIVGCYSVDKERNIHPDFSQLRYLVAPGTRKVNFNLNKAFAQFVDKSPTFAEDEKLDHILRFIKRNFAKLALSDKNTVLPYDFVCLRGVLKKIMMAPFIRENWTISAICLKGTIYLYTSEKEHRDYPDKKKFAHWGCQFSNYMFAKTPNDEPNGAEPFNSNEEFCVMFSSIIDKISLLYGVKVDGVESDALIEEGNETLNGAKLVEVKTSKLVTRHNVKSFAWKALKWYCQEYLIGVEDIYVGFRDDRGFVKDVIKIPVKTLPSDTRGLWNKEDCFKFLNAFLQFVQEIIYNESDPYTVWLFDYDWSQKAVSVRKEENNKNLLFLPDWYIELINKRN